MRVLILSINNNKGGAESILKQIYEYYIKKNIHTNVCFLTRSDSDFWNLKNQNIICISNNFSILKISYFLIKNRHNFDRVHTSHSKISFIIGILKRLRLFNSVIIARESTNSIKRYTGNKKRVYKILYKLCYSRIDVVICQSKEMLNDLSRYISISKLVHIKNPHKFMDHIDDESKNNKNFIMSAGRLINEKGFDILIKAFNDIKSTTNLNLKIFGDGPDKQKLENLIKELKLSDRVTLEGYSKNIINHMRSSDACIVSSRIEGFPNVLLEMMSVNNNIVSTLCSGDIESISGIYKAKTHDISDLSLKIKECLSKDNSESRTLFTNELKNRNIENFMKSALIKLDSFK